MLLLRMLLRVLLLRVLLLRVPQPRLGPPPPPTDSAPTPSPHPSPMVIKWFMTLFTRSFPFDLVTRVWDSFIYDGWKIVFRVMLALLKLAAPALMNESLEGIMRKIHHVPQQIGHDAEKVWRVAFSFRLRRANIADLAQEYLKSIGQAGGPKDGKQQI